METIHFERMRGFTVLTSTLIISSLFLLVCISASKAIVLVTEAVQDEEQYRRSQLNAFSCGVFALERLGADPTRFQDEGTTTIQLSAQDWCGIVSASSTADSADTFVFGSSTRSWVSMYITGRWSSSTNSFQVQSWKQS